MILNYHFSLIRHLTLVYLPLLECLSSLLTKPFFIFSSLFLFLCFSSLFFLETFSKWVNPQEYYFTNIDFLHLLKVSENVLCFWVNVFDSFHRTGDSLVLIIQLQEFWNHANLCKLQVKSTSTPSLCNPCDRTRKS